jgi:small ligand-binding sensory domain FIST
MLGIDRKTGAVAVADVVPQGTWVSFLLRDAEAARDDLRARVLELKAALGGKAPAFGLYFDCLGRGAGLYGEPGVDTAIIREHLGEFPLAGFFGNGELAPFMGSNLVHNYTGVLLLVGS